MCDRHPEGGAAAKLTLRMLQAVIAHTWNPSTWEAEADRVQLKQVYKSSSRTARNRQRNPISENRETGKNAARICLLQIIPEPSHSKPCNTDQMFEAITTTRLKPPLCVPG